MTETLHIFQKVFWDFTNFDGCLLYFGTFWNLGKVVSDAKTYACCGVFHKGCLRHTSQGEPSWVPWEKSAKTNWQFRAWKLNLSFAWHFVSFELVSLFSFSPPKKLQKKDFQIQKEPHYNGRCATMCNWNQTLIDCFAFRRTMLLLASGKFAAKFQCNHLSLV